MIIPYFSDRGGRVNSFGAYDTRAATIYPYPLFPQGVALGYRALQTYGLHMATSAIDGYAQGVPTRVADAMNRVPTIYPCPSFSQGGALGYRAMQTYGLHTLATSAQ